MILRPNQKPMLGTPLYHSDPGLVGDWLFNENGGMVVQDTSGNKKNGILSSTDIIWTPGIHGPSLNFDGTDSIDTQANYTTSANGLTIAVWLKTNTVASINYIVDHSVGTTGFGFRHDEDWEFFCYSSGAPGLVATPGNHVVSGKWTFVVAVHDTTNRIYVDGALDTTPVASTIGIDNASDTMRIAAQYDGSSGFDGQIDAVQIYNKGLSDLAIKKLFHDSSWRYRADPIALWAAATAGPAPPAGDVGIMSTWGGYWGATY